MREKILQIIEPLTGKTRLSEWQKIVQTLLDNSNKEREETQVRHCLLDPYKTCSVSANAFNFWKKQNTH
jgi:hypothetical protein